MSTRIAGLAARIAAAATLTAAAYAAVPTAPASAATCSSTHGVSVVVDFHQLSGGVQTACVAGGGGDTAASLFPAAGFPLTYVQRQPGFVCRVSGKPADDPCVNTPPADAYWGLWWSDGKSGSWNYSTAGAGGLRIPEGGYVAFSWNGSSTRSAPGASPSPHANPAPSPSDPPPSPASPGGSDAGGSNPGGGQHSANPGGSPDPSATSTSPSDEPAATDSAGPETSAKPGKPDRSGKAGKPGRADKADKTRKPGTATPSATVTDQAAAVPVEATSDPTDPGDGGLPAWVAPAAIVLLFGTAGAVAVVRRRRGAGST